jgi:hypothetical protein
VGGFPRQCVAEVPSVAETAVDLSRVAGFPARATVVVEPLHLFKNPIGFLYVYQDFQTSKVDLNKVL